MEYCFLMFDSQTLKSSDAQDLNILLVNVFIANPENKLVSQLLVDLNDSKSRTDLQKY